MPGRLRPFQLLNPRQAQQIIMDLGRALEHDMGVALKRFRWITRRLGRKQRTSAADRTRSPRWRAGTKRNRRAGRKGGRI